MSAGMERNPCLHGLRGALAFALFLHHVANSKLPGFDGLVGDLLQPLLMAMEYGVELFFGISGIVIVFAFQKSPSALGFLGNRALRIFPVLWTTIAVIVVLSGFDARHAASVDAPTFLANLLALPPLLPFRLIHPAAWSISYEFAFYAMFVLFALLNRALPRRVAIGVIAIVGAAGVFGHLLFACFGVGLLIAVRATRTTSPNPHALPLQDWAGSCLLASLLCWHASFAGLPGSQVSLPFMLGHPGALALFVLGLLFAGCGLSGIYNGRGLFARCLRWPLMQWLGRISFSLYLWQTVTLAIVKAGMLRAQWPDALGPASQLVFLALALPPTLLVAHLSQRWVEDRFTRSLRRALAGLAPRRRIASPVAPGHTSRRVD